MKLCIVPEADISPAEDAAIRAGLCICFPPDREVFSRTRAWHGSHPAWSVLVRLPKSSRLRKSEQGDLIVAHAGIVERQILVGHERVAVAGVLNVFVVPEYRGRGLFRKVMSVALEEARRRRLDFGLLFCTLEIGRKYERQGWQWLEGRSVTRIDEHGRPQPLPAKNVILCYPLCGRDMPPGDLHLLGNDW